MEPMVATPDEARELLKISRDEIKNKLQNGEIPAYRDGRNWKIPISLLRKYVEERALKEAAERRQENGN